MTPKIRIIVAEAREVFRKSFVALLQTHPDFEVLGDAPNGRQLLDQLKQAEADIVILDTQMPVMDGRTTMNVIHRRFPKVKVIILSDESNAQLQSDFMSKGASSFLNKNCNVNTLFQAILQVKSEGFFFDPATSRALLDIIKDKQRNPVPEPIKFNDRETEVLKGICDGKTNKEIAVGLHLSISTIDFYRTKIYGKTKCNNVTGLLKYALRNGLVSLT